jgi:3-oxoacyl-[acyl-carrier-protein] synthase II
VRDVSNVVITGTGVVSVAGTGASRILQAMTSGANLFDQPFGHGESSSRLPWPVAKIDPADTAWPEDDAWWVNNRKFSNPATQWAVTAAYAALRTAGTAGAGDPERGGVVMAMSSGDDDGLKVIPKLAALAQTDPRALATILYDEVPDYSYVRGIPSQAGQFIAKASGFSGSNVAVYGESAAGGLSAVSLASRLIESGELDRVIVVGVAAPLSPGVLAFLDRTDPISPEATPGRGPFDIERRGILLGHGAAAIVFERKDLAAGRGIQPLAELSCCDTVCAPSLPEAMASAVDLVLMDVTLDPEVWWAGTGSVSLDEMEARAVGPRVRAITTSTKGTIGNAFECAGLIDIAVAVEALSAGVVPPVGLLRTPDPALGALDFVCGSARPAPRAQSALVTMFGHPTSGMTTAGAALITRISGES